MTTDVLFAIQIGFTFIWGGSQFLRLLSSMQEVNISWFVCWLAFLLLNLVLAVRAHANQASRVTWQTIASYAAWTAMVLADLAVMLWRGTHAWDGTDTTTSLLVGGRGLSPVPVVTGHITILTRLGQLSYSIKEAGWDRNRRGSALSELANEGSWIVATAAWLVR